MLSITLRLKTSGKNYFQPIFRLLLKTTQNNGLTWEMELELPERSCRRKRVGIYNNIKKRQHAINKADDYTTFWRLCRYDSKGPAAWRIFLFNIFRTCTAVKDFTWPDQLMKGFVKQMPMLFTGSQVLSHMHFDIDLSHIVHTQFLAAKESCFPYNEQHKLYQTL